MSSHGSRPPSVSYAGSKAGSNATVTSEMSMQYRNQKVMKGLNAWYYGSGRFPFKIAIICFIVGFLIFFAGVVLLGLIFGQRQLDIGNWWGNIIAAGLIVGGILVFALGVKFLFDARTKSTRDRKKLAFRPTGLTKVSVVNNAYEADRESHYKTKSGTSSIKAVNSPYASSVGSRSHATHSVARTGDSMPSLDHRQGYSTNPNPNRPQGRYAQNPNRREEDRRYDDRRNDDRRSHDSRGYEDDRRSNNSRGYDDDRRSNHSRGYPEERRSLDGRLDDRRVPPDDRRSQDGRYDDRRNDDRRHDDRRYDDRRDNRGREGPPSRSASRDFDDIPLDDHSYI